jgi:hypothetical protein
MVRPAFPAAGQMGGTSIFVGQQKQLLGSRHLAGIG